jgi:hypothetical protein
MDLTDHLWADGCGKSAKAIAACMIMRSGYDQFEHAPWLKRAAGAGVDAAQFREWLEYHQILLGNGDG